MTNPGAKADKMKRKTEEMRRTFNLPDTETVIQDYACNQRRSVLIPGRMFISQNYVCFHATLPEVIESIPFRKIQEIVKDHTALLFNNAINIVSTTGTSYFGSFNHRDETFNLLSHLWKHPPSYFDIDDSVKLKDPNATNGGDASNGSTKESIFGSPDGSSNGSSNGSGNGYEAQRRSAEQPAGSRSSGGGGGSGQQQQQVKVDTDTSRNALRIALETREIGAATMNELSYQAEVIDLIERDVENIHNNIDKATKLVRGIESFGGTMANAFSSDKGSGHDLRYIDRTLISGRIEQPADVPILWKLSNDDLVPALMRFTLEKFLVINPAPKKGEKDLNYSYESVDSIVLRARPLHVDFRFKDKKAPRFRAMSSYVQTIVNEFSLRARSRVGEVPVSFEPGTRKFAYGNPTIPGPSADAASVAVGRKAGFFRKDGAATLPAAFSNASEDVKQGVLQQESDLNQISGVLGDLHGIATTMGREIDRQTEQLDRVTVRVDHANDRLKHTNHRIKDML